MQQILETLRSLLMDHLATAQSLTSDTPVGGSFVNIPNTSRFREGDEVWMMSSGSKLEANSVKEIVDDKVLLLNTPVVGHWRVNDLAYIQKVLAYAPLKRIHLGDLRQIPSFPTICLVPTGDSNDWMTLGSTTDEYKVAIRTYVLVDNFENANKTVIRYAEYIREVLTEHIRPIITGDHYALLEDLPVGGKVIKVSSTTAFASDMVTMGGSTVFLRDNMPHPSEQENYVKTVLSSTEIELDQVAEYEYKVSRGAEAIRVTRLLYDSRPESINYGYVQDNASLLLAAETSWWCKEQICRRGNYLS